MKIVSSDFITSVYNAAKCPRDNLPHIAFAGRSNVGKSSLINSLLNRKKLALVSASPGKTQALNFFLINKSIYFVDLPGYGYAKVPKSISKGWRTLVEGYLLNSGQLCGIVIITDIRHPLSPLDFELFNWLNAEQIPFCIVGTKADKLSGNVLKNRIQETRLSLLSTANGGFIPYSSVTGYGKAELWKQIQSFINHKIC
jgi:GTP-binding protein